MAFEKTIAVAQAESFAVVDEGFVLSEEQLNNVESALLAGDIAVEEMAAAAENIAALEATGAELVTANSAHALKIADQEEIIAALQAEVTALGKKPSGSGTTLVIEKDEESEQKPVPSYLDANNPINQYADRYANKK